MHHVFYCRAEAAANSLMVIQKAGLVAPACHHCLQTRSCSAVELVKGEHSMCQQTAKTSSQMRVQMRALQCSCHWKAEEAARLLVTAQRMHSTQRSTE